MPDKRQKNTIGGQVTEASEATTKSLTIDVGKEKVTSRLEQGTNMLKAGATQSGVHGSVPSVSSVLSVGDKATCN